MKLLLVEWLDSSSGRGWQTLDDVKKNAADPLFCRSVGWLVERNRKQITIASSLSGEKNPGIRINASGDISIPLKCVVRVKVIDAR